MRVKVHAIKRGVHVQSTPPGIIRFDPEGSDLRTRDPIVEHTEIPALVKAKLIDDPGDISKLEEVAAVSLDLSQGVDLARYGKHAAVAAGVRDGISATDTRGAVAFDPTLGVDAGEPGIAAGDPDAPPPAKNSRAKANAAADAPAAAPAAAPAVAPAAAPAAAPASDGAQK